MDTTRAARARKFYIGKTYTIGFQDTSKRLRESAKTHHSTCVAVPPVGPIQRRDIDMPFMDEEVVHNHDSRNGTQNNRITALECQECQFRRPTEREGEDGKNGEEAHHEVQEARCAREDDPRTQDPPAEDRAEDLTAPDVDIARGDRGEVVGAGDGISADVCCDGGEGKARGGKEGGSTVVPTTS